MRVGTVRCPHDHATPLDYSGYSIVRATFIITDTQFGGTPVRFADLSRGLMDRGWRIQLISLLPAGEVAHAIAREGVEIVDLRIRVPWHIPNAAARMRREIRRFDPDVVQSALFHANVLGRVVGRSLGIPVISGYQSLDAEMPRWRVILDQITAPFAAGHTAVSNAVAEHVTERSRLAPDRVYVVATGKAAPPPRSRSSARAALGISSEVIVVGFVGRLHPVKAIGRLADAVQTMEGEPWLLVVGDGEDRALLDGRPRTIVTGMRHDARELYAAMDVFVLTSRWEGMPGALLEAMVAGLPVVTTAVGGVDEVITDGVDGLLVPIDAEPTTIGNAIEVALHRPDLGVAASQTARTRFSLGGMIDSYEAIYRRLARGPARVDSGT